MKIVGERLRMLREGMQISQAKMAEIVGMKQSSINRYEGGETSPSYEVLLKYADFFDVSIDYIFGRTDNPQGKLYEYKPKALKNNKEMRQFVEMCFDPKSPMNDRLKQTLIQTSTKERLEKLEAQREDLKVGILQAQLQRPRYTKEQVTSWIGRFKYGNADDPQYQKQIIDTFINSIYVFDDKLVFTYNFKDGTEAITLKDIEAAFGSDLAQVAPPNLRNPSLVPIGSGVGFFVYIEESGI